MKTVFKRIGRLSAVAALALFNRYQALASSMDFDQALATVDQKVRGWGSGIASLVQLVSVIAAIVLAGWNFWLRNKGEGQNNDKLVTLAYTSLAVFAIITVLRAIGRFS